MWFWLLVVLVAWKQTGYFSCWEQYYMVHIYIIKYYNFLDDIWNRIFDKREGVAFFFSNPGCDPTFVMVVLPLFFVWARLLLRCQSPPTLKWESEIPSAVVIQFSSAPSLSVAKAAAAVADSNDMEHECVSSDDNFTIFETQHHRLHPYIIIM